MSDRVPLEICACFKNESLYIREWIEFHRIIGFTKFHLYNNNSTDSYKEVLEPYIRRGVVDLVEWCSEVPAQLAIYQDLIDRNNKRKVWMAFIDLDEFLYSPREDMRIDDMLNTIDRPLSIAINWRCFGNSGHYCYEPGLILERFTYRPAEHIPDKHIKSIIRLDQDVKVSSDPHFFWCDNCTFNEQNHMIIGPFAQHSTQLFCINHYVTKSRQEYYEKRKRGRADVVLDDFSWELFESLEPMDIQDLTIQRFLPELRERMSTNP